MMKLMKAHTYRISLLAVSESCCAHEKPISIHSLPPWHKFKTKRNQYDAKTINSNLDFLK